MSATPRELESCSGRIRDEIDRMNDEFKHVWGIRLRIALALMIYFGAVLALTAAFVQETAPNYPPGSRMASGLPPAPALLVFDRPVVEDIKRRLIILAVPLGGVAIFLITARVIRRDRSSPTAEPELPQWMNR
jgi:hypothetical protein